MRNQANAEMDSDWIDTLLEELKTAFQRTTQTGNEQLAELASRVTELERSLSEAYELLVATEHQASRLANLYVSAYQLHASLDPMDVHGAVAEIAVNLLGAASCVLLLSLDREQPGHEVINLVPDVAVAAPFERRRYAGGDPMVDAALRDGTVRMGPDQASRAIAAVPLVVQGSVVGALVVLALLPHKESLHDQDHELLDLLGAHTASALVGAHAFNEAQRKLRTMEGIVSLLRRTP